MLRVAIRHPSGRDLGRHERPSYPTPKLGRASEKESIMMRRTGAILATLILTVGSTALIACGDDDSGGSDTGLDTSFQDIETVDVDTTQDTTNPNAVKKLDFEAAFGDDQAPCRQTDRCTVYISFTERRSLNVVYTEDGVPKAGQVVKFALESDPDGLGFLNTLSAVTTPQGVASAETKAKLQQIGQFAVKAWIDNSNLPPLYFDVVVTPKGQVPLTVVGGYQGTRPVGSYNVRLYRQDNGGAPNCDDIMNLVDNETAAQARDNILLAQSAKFPDFDALEQDGTQRFTILAMSENANGAIQAWGCCDGVNDTACVDAQGNPAWDGQVVWGQSKTVPLQLTDRPPQYAGAYNITSRFDFVSAIPEPYRTWVNYIVGFFQSPSGTLLQLACDLLTGEGEDLNSFCDLVFDQQPNGDLTLTTLGGFASDLIDAIIEGLAQDSTFGTIFQVGGDVADILKAFEIQATLQFNKEPNAEGVWEAGDTSENWHTVTVKWTLGANCDPVTDAGCGVMQFSTSAFQQQAITGTFAASVANDFDLTIEQHSLNLNYGALVSYFLEQFLIPLVTGEPLVDSYEELIGYLVGGGVECLQPTASGLDCCGTFADNTGNEDGQLSGAQEGAINAACSTIAQAGPAFLRSSLTGLDQGTGNAFKLGTLTPCRLSDFNEDLVIDGVGTQAQPCVWNVQIGNSSETFDAIFWGARAE